MFENCIATVSTPKFGSDSTLCVRLGIDRSNSDRGTAGIAARQCPGLANPGPPEGQSDTSALPPTSDIEMGMSPFPAIRSALSPTTDVPAAGLEGQKLTHFGNKSDCGS